MSYEVHLDAFDGPFDLLLQLIAAQQVDLYEIRLADIVDGFLAETRRIGKIDLDLATEFLLIASTLLELKCRRLLPGRDDVDLDDDLALFEARDYLLARLVECKTFSCAAEVLAQLEHAAQRSLARRTGPDERFERIAPDLLAGLTADDVAKAAVRALTGRGGTEPEPALSGQLRDDETSVQAALDEVVGALSTRRRMTFRELTARSPSRIHVVACFLAVLELYKQSLVELDQLATFGDLTVVWTDSAVPHPGDIVAIGYDDVPDLTDSSDPKDVPDLTDVPDLLSVAADVVHSGHGTGGDR